MIIKVLVENTELKGFFGEHGLCLYVEYKGKAYLIDSGASGLFAENADKLGGDVLGDRLIALSTGQSVEI